MKAKMRIAVIVGVLLTGSWAMAAPVNLCNATATFSQTGPQPNLFYSIQCAIDGQEPGWAIIRDSEGNVNSALPETAVFESAEDIDYAGVTTLTFQLVQAWYDPHNIGRFRLSATTSPRNLFADGLASLGDVGSPDIWTALAPSSLQSANGTVLSLHSSGDGSILASGPNPLSETYTIVAQTTLRGITGFRLDVLSDESLPYDGPGRAWNGNFVLQNFSVDATPEPATLSLLALGGVALLRRKSKV